METVNPKAAACAAAPKFNSAAIFPEVKDISVLHRSCCHCRRGGSVRSAHRCHVGCLAENYAAHWKLARHSLSGAGRYGLRRTGCVSYILPEHNPHSSCALIMTKPVEPERRTLSSTWRAAAKPWKTARRLSARTITTRWCRSRRNTKSTVSAWMIFWRRKPDENYCYRKSERRYGQNDYRV